MESKSLGKANLLRVEAAIYTFARNGQKYADTHGKDFLRKYITEETAMKGMFGFTYEHTVEPYGDNLIIGICEPDSTEMAAFTNKDGKRFYYEIATIHESSMVFATKNHTPLGDGVDRLVEFAKHYFREVARDIGAHQLEIRVGDEVDVIIFSKSAAYTCEETPQERRERREAERAKRAEHTKLAEELAEMLARDFGLD